MTFAVLIFMTSLQSEDQQQKEAAILDGAGPWSQFLYLTIPSGAPYCNCGYDSGDFPSVYMQKLKLSAGATGIKTCLI